MKTHFLSLIALFLLLSSCAIHSGSISSTEIGTDVIFEDTSYGVSEAKYFLGLGGLSQQTMINDAKKKLYQNRPLKKNESYVNFSVDIKRSYYILVSKQTVTVSADIVKKETITPETRFSETFRNKLISASSDLFKTGDKIMDTDFEKGTIAGFIGDKTVIVHYVSGKVVNKAITSVFNTEVSYRGIHIGSDFSDAQYKGKVVALGVHKLIIVDEYNFYRSVFYK